MTEINIVDSLYAREQLEKEQQRKRSAKWRADNREVFLASQRRTNIKVLYGISLEERDALLAAQGGCAICKSSDPKGKLGWHVDHDHTTMKIRGILCCHCNRLLGAAEDDIEILKTAIAYLEQNK